VENLNSSMKTLELSPHSHKLINYYATLQLGHCHCHCHIPTFITHSGPSASDWNYSMLHDCEYFIGMGQLQKM